MRFIVPSAVLMLLLGSGCSPLPPEFSDSGQDSEATASGTTMGSGTATVGNDTSATNMGTGMGTGMTATTTTAGVDSDTTTTATGADSDTATTTDPPTSSESTSAAECMPGECPGQVCIQGTCTTVTSCDQIHQMDHTLPSGVYELEASDGSAYGAYCDMEFMDGGWTLVFKASGASPTFEYDSPLWANEDTVDPASSDLDRTEARLASWSEVPFTAVLIGMESPIGSDPDALEFNYLAIPVADTSLFDLMSPNTPVLTALGRSAWLDLIDDSTLQDNCNREGFNIRSDGPGEGDLVAQRIGIIGNDDGNCSLADSRLGIGGLSGTTVSGNCGIDMDPNGNFAGCLPDSEPSVNLPAFAAVFVR